MTLFNARLRQLEKIAPLAEDAEVERLVLAMRELTDAELNVLRTVIDDPENFTPAQKAVLLRVGIMVPEQQEHKP